MRGYTLKGGATMIIDYKTKPDINGNVYRLQVDHEKRTFERDRYWTAVNPIRVTRKELRALIDQCKAAGYKEING